MATVVGVVVRSRHVRCTVRDSDKRLPFRTKWTSIGFAGGGFAGGGFADVSFGGGGFAGGGFASGGFVGSLLGTH